MPDEAKKAEEVKEEKTIDIDTSGPDVEVTLPEEKDKAVVEIKEEVRMKNLLKSLLSPMTHLRNLMSSLMFRKAYLKQKTRNKN